MPELYAHMEYLFALWCDTEDYSVLDAWCVAAHYHDDRKGPHKKCEWFN